MLDSLRLALLAATFGTLAPTLARGETDLLGESSTSVTPAEPEAELPPPPMPPPLPDEPEEAPKEPAEVPRAHPPAEEAPPAEAPSPDPGADPPPGPSVGAFPPPEADEGVPDSAPDTASAPKAPTPIEPAPMPPPESAPVAPNAPTPYAGVAPTPDSAPTADTTATGSSPPASAPEATEPAQASPESEPQKKSAGVHFYFGAAATLLLGTKSTHEWDSTCPSVTVGGVTQSAECSTQSPIGGWGEVDFGLRGKYFGGELFLAGAGDYSRATLSLGPDVVLPEFANGTHVGRAGGGGGLTLRGFLAADLIGVSAGAGVGVVWRGVFTNLSSTGGQFEQYVAPVFKFDAELMLLKVFHLGLMGLVEFAPDVRIRPDLSAFPGGAQFSSFLDEITVFSGTQVFLGPYVALRTP